MATIFQFPAKDGRQWEGVASEIEKLFASLGATDKESSQLLERLRPRWEALGKPFDIQLSHSLVGPLSPEQLASFEQALPDQAAEITQRFKTEHAATLIEFAKLELQLLKLQSAQSE